MSPLAGRLSADGTERFCRTPAGVELCFRTDGDPSGTPVLLIAGVTQQLTAWPDPFVRALVDRGCHVVRLDNRDIGRSSRIDLPPPGPLRQLTRRLDPRQYTLADMAQDTAHLLDHLDVQRAHVVGMSMGGMIAQTLAARHPERVQTLTSIFSTTGHWRAGRTGLRGMLHLARRPAANRDQAADRLVGLLRHIGSRGVPFDEPAARIAALAAYDRGDGASAHDGIARQVGAILKSGDRTRELRSITAPTLVLHGDRDPMVHPSGGAATAAAIRGARHVVVPGMGHDLPTGLVPRIAELVDRHITQNTPGGER